ncbi:hypothetical protein F7734_54620 [Scytonema sp. UIC 10036]|uniref:hypothetical protein n=1 Tax=Scytonema sp. UIC 10036 TaxID=2304196 RepID=UPI0012DA31F2|nr:hypothetical protein [Scytonema sp. UIC 10036]MUH00834.1 hypothetical protein [Scytonema sp. UIC 10036]
MTSEKSLKILLLAANPQNTLRLEEEVQAIKAVLKRGKNRERFEIITKFIVRVDDLHRALLEYEPKIVHFFGHGSGEHGLALEDSTGITKLVSLISLAKLFELFANLVECVLLDGCYSEIQANAIAQNISYVIGISRERDFAALDFAASFYDALATGRSIEEAYQFGSAAISLRRGDISECLTPILVKRGQLKLQEYDRATKRYEEEFSQAVQQECPLSEESRLRLNRLRSILGIRNEDAEAIETRVNDIQEMRLALKYQSIRNYQRLAQAILRRIGATDITPISSPQFPEGSLWDMTLPSTGLQIPTQSAIFYLNQETDSIPNDQLQQITQQREGAFLICASVTNNCPHRLTPLPVIWLSSSSLMEMIATPDKDLLVWLARFLFGQINIVALPGMLPYKTRGIAKLFFGRENELARITSGDQRGGIIIGAHRSGKTSFLEKLKEKLQQRFCKVIGPLTFFEFQSFFKDTLDPLGKSYFTGMSIQDWSSALKIFSINNPECRLIFLLDEVDKVIQEDIKTGSNLGQMMRALQNGGFCEFFLAGHAKLREAIAIEGGPFRNFAEEITLTGLTQESATDLIQRPMKLLGFEVSDLQANRIYQGTAGVAVLIQEFCLQLLDGLRQSGASEINDAMIEEVEECPGFLDIVFDHYKYGQTWDSIAITLFTAMNGEVQRKDITGVFQQYGIDLKREQLDRALDFLCRFGVLEKFRYSYYRVLSGYLIDAIKANDPESLLESELDKGRVA